MEYRQKPLLSSCITLKMSLWLSQSYLGQGIRAFRLRNQWKGVTQQVLSCQVLALEADIRRFCGMASTMRNIAMLLPCLTQTR